MEARQDRRGYANETTIRKHVVKRQLKDYVQQRRGEVKTHTGGESDDDSAERRLRQRNPIPQSH